MREEQPVVEAVKKPSSKRWGVLVMIPLCMVFIVLFAFSVEWQSSLKVQHVFVDDMRCVSKKEITSLAKIETNAKLYAIDLNEIRQRIMTQPYVKSARVNREFPDGISIGIEERVPVASINAGQLHYVDAEGMLLPGIQTQQRFDLPVISGIDGIASAQPGKVVTSKEFFTAIMVLQSAVEIDSTIYRMISEVDMNHGGDIKLYSADVGALIILGRDSISKKLLMLEEFWSKFIASGDAEKLQYVDLRYEDQVVVKWKQQPEHQSNKTSL